MFREQTCTRMRLLNACLSSQNKREHRLCDDNGNMSQSSTLYINSSTCVPGQTTFQFTSKTKTSALKLGKHARQRKGSRDRIIGQLGKRVLVTRAQAAEIRVIEHQKCNRHETPTPIQHQLAYVVGQAHDEVSRKAPDAPQR